MTMKDKLYEISMFMHKLARSIKDECTYDDLDFQDQQSLWGARSEITRMIEGEVEK